MLNITSCPFFQACKQLHFTMLSGGASWLTLANGLWWTWQMSLFFFFGEKYRTENTSYPYSLFFFGGESWSHVLSTGGPLSAWVFEWLCEELSDNTHGRYFITGKKMLCCFKVLVFGDCLLPQCNLNLYSLI